MVIKNGQQYFTTLDISQYLNVNRRTVHLWISSHIIPPSDANGVGGRYLWSVHNIKDWLDSKKVKLDNNPQLQAKKKAKIECIPSPDTSSKKRRPDTLTRQRDIEKDRCHMEIFNMLMSSMNRNMVKYKT